MSANANEPSVSDGDTSQTQSLAKTPLALTLHPLLIAVVPIVMVAALNVEMVELNGLVGPIAISVVGCFVASAIWWAFLRQWEQTAIISTLCLFFFYAHGHLHSLLSPFLDVSSKLIHLLILVAWLLVLGFAIRFVRKSRPQALAGVSQFLTVVLGMLLAISVYQLYTGFANRSELLVQGESRDVLLSMPDYERKAERSDLPDIYYVILDGYGRDDKLLEVCGHDNSEFTAWLESKGFYVCSESNSNYATTFLSLASSLNMRYINEDGAEIGAESRERMPIYSLLRRNSVARYLQAQGYTFVNFNTSFSSTQRSSIADYSFPFSLSEFHTTLLRTTMFEPFVWRLPFPSGGDLHLYHFNKLGELAEWKEPTFAFAHIVCPHGPFYFERDGTRRVDIDPDPESWSAKKNPLYVDQLIFVNSLLKELVETLVVDAENPPIIILQADHGSAFLLDESQPPESQVEFVRERMAILNAYLVPEQCRQQLKPSTSPVNTFRILFNAEFGESLPLLPEQFHFSWYQQPYQFRDVTEDVRPSNAGDDQ